MKRDPRPWSQKKRFKVATVALATLVGLVFGEALLRIFVVQQAKRITVYDSDLGWISTPNGRGLFVREADGIRVPYSFNSKGFRGGEWPPVNGGAWRVVLLGDSMLESLEVPYESTIPLLIERLCKGPSRPIQLTAISCRGWGTDQELIAYRKFGRERRPQRVVLVFYPGNDFIDNVQHRLFELDDEGDLVRQAAYDTPWMAAYQTAGRWAYANLYTAFYFKHGADYLLLTLLSHGFPLPLEGVRNPAERELTHRLLLRLRREVSKDGAQLTIAVVVGRREIERGDFSAEDLVSQWCSEDGLDCLPLQREMTREMFFGVDPHLNPAGQRFVAGRIAQALADGGSTTTAQRQGSL